MQIDGINVDEKALNRLYNKILVLENDNIRTNKYSDNEMKKIIKKWIEEEVKCCSNQ